VLQEWLLPPVSSVRAVVPLGVGHKGPGRESTHSPMHGAMTDTSRAACLIYTPPVFHSLAAGALEVEVVVAGALFCHGNYIQGITWSSCSACVVVEGLLHRHGPSNNPCDTLCSICFDRYHRCRSISTTCMCPSFFCRAIWYAVGGATECARAGQSGLHSPAVSHPRLGPQGAEYHQPPPEWDEPCYSVQQ
jgi:hypothetical protein